MNNSHRSMLIVFSFVFSLMATTAIAEDDFKHIFHRKSVVTLIEQLNDDQYQTRVAAQQKLIEVGEKIIDHSIHQLTDRASNLYDEEIGKLFDSGRDRIEKTLRPTLFEPLSGVKGEEVEFRSTQIRLVLRQMADDRWMDACRHIARPLGDEYFKSVYGVTGGWRGGTTFFDAKYENSSKHTITGIRILVKLIDKQTNVEFAKEIELGPLGFPIAPGQIVRLSGDTGMRRLSNHNFYWETRKVTGYPSDTVERDAKSQ